MYKFPSDEINLFLMNHEEAKILIRSLTDDLNHYNYLYYQKNKSEVSDYEFDMKLKELESLETMFPDLKLPYSPTSRVGGDITKEFETVPHKYPMLSLGNTYSKDELEEFDGKIKKGLKTENYEYVCELKFDGVAISLIYENGILIKGITRGDGMKGDNIIQNVKTIHSIPLKLKNNDCPALFEVRGEVYMTKELFIQLNDKIKEENESRKAENKDPLVLYANARNTTSGTLKMKDPSSVAQRKLDCYVYSYLDDANTFATHEECLKFLKEIGFNVSHTYKKCKNIKEVFEYINQWDKERHKLSVEIDGIVIKVNNLTQQLQLGSTARNPRWAISYKFQSESAITTLYDITYQVGRTGAITPVAELKPILLAGTTVKRASLHNANQIERLDIRIGDSVKIEKGGEIIPKIISVDKKNRPAKAKKISYTTHCMECHTKLIRKEDEVQHYCPNSKSCPPQVLGRIEHFISRNAMNIESLGYRTISSFLTKGLIQNIAHLYTLSFEDINNLQFEEVNELTSETVRRSIKEKSAKKIIQSIENSKKMPFECLLYGLGIRHVGKTIAEKLAQHFISIDRLMNASFEDIVAIHEIGDRIAKSIISFFSMSENQKIISSLKEAGLSFEIVQKKNMKDTFKGFNLVISGVFENFERDEIEELIKQHAGRVVSSISSKTNYLVGGKNMGPSKKEKAKTLGIPILDESSFIELIKND